VASGPFKYRFGALMWLWSTLKKSSPKKKKNKQKKKKQKELINHI